MISMSLITIAVGLGTMIGGLIYKDFIVMFGGLVLIIFSLGFLLSERRDMKGERK